MRIFCLIVLVCRPLVCVVSLCFLGMLLCCGFCVLFDAFLKVVWVSLFTLGCVLLCVL